MKPRFLLYFHLKKLNSERLTVRLGLTIVYFPIFRQAQPDFFRECEHSQGIGTLERLSFNTSICKKKKRKKYKLHNDQA